MRPYKQVQTRFHRGLLRSGAAVPHGLPHQAIVDVNIRAHNHLSPDV
jgi:hypothetical protein